MKLQALVRGYMVRKQAAATLRSMEALVRAQSSVCAQKFHAMNRLQDSKVSKQTAFFLISNSFTIISFSCYNDSLLRLLIVCLAIVTNYK